MDSSARDNTSNNLILKLYIRKCIEPMSLEVSCTFCTIFSGPPVMTGWSNKIDSFISLCKLELRCPVSVRFCGFSWSMRLFLSRRVSDGSRPESVVKITKMEDSCWPGW